MNLGNKHSCEGESGGTKGKGNTVKPAMPKLQERKEISEQKYWRKMLDPSMEK
jgi:hypothetical protein